MREGEGGGLVRVFKHALEFNARKMRSLVNTTFKEKANQGPLYSLSRPGRRPPRGRRRRHCSPRGAARALCPAAVARTHGTIMLGFCPVTRSMDWCRDTHGTRNCATLFFSLVWA